MLDDIQFVDTSPTVQEYQLLRSSVGWSPVSDHAVQASLNNSLFSLSVYINDSIVAFGRIIGDSGIYYYIQDLMVLPEYQRKGIGKEIMNGLMAFIKLNADPTAFVGLMAAKGFWQFYEPYGFQKRSSNAPGMFRYVKPKNL